MWKSHIFCDIQLHTYMHSLEYVITEQRKHVICKKEIRKFCVNSRAIQAQLNHSSPRNSSINFSLDHLLRKLQDNYSLLLSVPRKILICYIFKLYGVLLLPKSILLKEETISLSRNSSETTQSRKYLLYDV